MWSCSVTAPSYMQSAKSSREYVWALWLHYFYLRQEILPSLYISSSALHFIAQHLMKVEADGVKHWCTNLLCTLSPSRQQFCLVFCLSDSFDSAIASGLLVRKSANESMLKSSNIFQISRCYTVWQNKRILIAPIVLAVCGTGMTCYLKIHLSILQLRRCSYRLCIYKSHSTRRSAFSSQFHHLCSSKSWRNSNYW
jgi:hypothetical protein